MTKILIADDLPENRYMLRSLLSASGYEVREAPDGAQALAMALDDAPDLIVADILMPVMDGFELCRKWKSHERLQSIPFVFYTATYTSDEDERLAKAVGADRFLIKPMQPEALLEALQGVLKDVGAFGVASTDKTPEGDKEVLRRHNEALLRKLEKKVHDLRSEADQRRKLEASLAQADRLASMGMLAAGVAHEINNPLSYVLYNLEALKEQMRGWSDQVEKIAAALGPQELSRLLGPGPSIVDVDLLRDLLETFTETVEGGNKIRDILKGLSAFALGNKTLPGPVDPHWAIESALTVASNEIKYRARVERDFGPVSPVVASEAHLCQIFLNLVVNAAHSISEGRLSQNSISIRTWQHGKTVCAEIADTGCGIPKENLKRIFEPFFTTKLSGVGSGLGLGIVKTLVERYSGQIEVESEVGRGTRFTVRLPAAGSPGEAAPSPGDPPQSARFKKGRILIVDDDDLVRAVLETLLAAHDIVSAASGREAISVLTEDQRFDLVLCDLMMADISGVEVHEWLAQHHEALAQRLVFVTGGAFTEAAREYLSRVDNPRLPKPITAKELRAKVALWLERETTK